MSGIYLLNSTSVGIFGMVAAAFFCDICWTRKKILLMTGSILWFRLSDPYLHEPVVGWCFGHSGIHVVCMQYLSSCIENGKIEQAQAYIQEICSEIEANKVTAFCENEAANLIFSSFAGRALDLDIPIKIKAMISQSLPISETDLCVLLSNAMENALHACQKLKKKGLAGMIEVSAYEKSGKFFLQVINSCDEDITFEYGVPVTYHPGHGIGVRSICTVVEKYGGIYTFLVKDDRFILRVSF